MALKALRRIGVFRALVLGDLLCATPALRALRLACPDAEISLIGLPWAGEFVERLASVDRFVACPGIPGLRETGDDVAALPAFLSAMQARRFDLLLQLHGSGGIVNSLLAACGPCLTAGFVEPGGYALTPAWHVDWPTSGHEIERMLRATDRLGIARDGTALDFPVRAADTMRLLQQHGHRFDGRPIACVHAGAQLPSRRWPADRFAAIARRLHDSGWQVVLTGSAGEAALAAQVGRLADRDILDLAGGTSLWTLGAMLQRSALLVCNDTGVSHVAAALGTTSVVVSSGADAARWAPLATDRHRVLWSPAPCRPCGHAVCPFQHECATAVTVDAVWQEIESVVRQWPDPAGVPFGPGSSSSSAAARMSPRTEPGSSTA